MGNPHYLKGVRKERKICKELREQGFDIVQRSAGSNSPIDVFAINKLTRVIKFIQAKPDDFDGRKILEELGWLNNAFRVEFEVL